MESVERELFSVTAFENDIDTTVHGWEKKVECKTLSAVDFREFWARNVPVIYSLKPECDCLNIRFNEELAKKILFEPLGYFICGSKDLEKAFEQIRTMDSAPSLCGKVFKSGEPTYACRDCGLDPTCVLCVDCFKKSTHRHHRYKMSTSGGGGYCDCGDEEAWKKFAFCEIHHKGKTEVPSESPLDKLPQDLIERLRIVMQVILHYCYQMLSWPQAVTLPQDLQHYKDTSTPSDIPDTYTTVLFNDETHTYEQVSETLNKAIGCTKKAAFDFATMIDREGRSIVKCSTFVACTHVRNVIERFTTRHVASSLKVVVMHTDVLAHQMFAMKLLVWLQKILALHEGFRHVFSQLMIEPVESESTLLESVMLKDTQLWKAARNQWHQLFISGMLMDQQCKKIFAKTFTRIYPVIIKDFMADDHDHSISVTSLGVQIYTVPSLAHTLIEEDDAISVLLRAFLAECERNKNEEGRLAFQRSQMNNMNNTFRRAHYILYDLKYLITSTPGLWNDQLRRNFLHGVHSYLNLLNLMQGMDAVTRQIGQHIEYEAEWETGINLQLKIASLSNLFIQWCTSDFTVYVKAFRAALKLLQPALAKSICIGVEIANHSASCIEYEVSSMPVTIHLPLSRFAAGLFLYMEKFGLHYEGPHFQFEGAEKPSPEHLMELPLRTLVMLAQFRAGMWRRNGYSLSNQVYFYHNVRFREEMFDRDIMMLQIAASMIESNEFLIHIIYKFGLLMWAEESYDGTQRKSEEDNIKHMLTVAEEFLALLLTIISERHTPGIGKVTESDRIKKEIVQLLCIEAMPHSQLFKMLPKDRNNETGMEQVVNEVASFRKPQGPGTGKYELKPEYLENFNPFYYHYTREDQSKAEEAQLKRKKQTYEEVCCPPPLPPEFESRFAILNNMLQCDVMLHILHLVFARTLNLHCAAFSEAQFEKALHIVGVALHEEQRSLYRDGENSYFMFTSKATKKGIKSLMEDCLKSPRVESHKELLKWVLSKFKLVEVQRAKEKGEHEDILVESIAEKPGDSSNQNKKQKADLAAARKARIMAHMSALQKNFLREHADLFKQALLEDPGNMPRCHSDNHMDFSADDPVSIGRKQCGRLLVSKVYTCILCREDQDVTFSGRAIVLAAFVQRSSVLSKNRKHIFKDPQNYDPMQFPADLFCAPHTSTCGHVMHSDCWQKFYESVLHKEQRRPVRFGRHMNFNVEKSEYLCPLCERLSNSVIPLLPPLMSERPPKNYRALTINVDDWLSCMKKVVENILTEKPKATVDENRSKQMPLYCMPRPIEEIVSEMPPVIAEQFTALFSGFQAPSSTYLSESLIQMMNVFAEATYTVGLSTHINYYDVRVPAMSWWSCAYTIHSIEWLLRLHSKPLFGKLSSRNALCLEALVRFVCSSLSIFDHDVVRTQSIRLLRYLLLGEHHVSSPHCCLDMDAFAVLVFLVLSMPVLFKQKSKEDQSSFLFPLGTQLDRHIMHLMYIFHLVQLLLSYEFNEDSMEMDSSAEGSAEGSDNLVALNFFRDLRTAAGVDDAKPIPSSYTVIHCIRYGSLPFLRCAALFFHVLSDTAAPDMLQDTNDVEFEHLCKYLGLPTTIRELLSSPSLKQLALNWVRHPRILHLLLLPEASGTLPVVPMASTSTEDQKIDLLVRHPLSVNHLIPLPSDYSELINNVSLFSCPNSVGDDSRNPTMCLVCGQVLCSQSYCCQMDLENNLVGACTYHAYCCGAGVGIFLRIWDCKILLLSDKTKGCFMAPPYVDDYGETDQGLFRGNPLHLCHEKYEELNELWLGHNIPEHVSHAIEQSTSLPNWQLL